MSRSAASPASAGRPRKSPLRLAAIGEPSFPARREGLLSPAQLRAMMISEIGAARTPSSATCGTCSPGRKPSTTIPTLTRTN
jgi:hypothetical protein